MKKYFLIAAFTIGILNYGITQVNIGIRTGIHNSTVAHNGSTEVVEEISSTRTSAYIGAFGEYEFSPNWSVRAGINYLNKGTSLGYSDDINVFGINLPVGVSTDFVTKNIEIPLSLQYKYPIDGRWSAFGSAGAGVSKSISAQLKPRINSILDFNLPTIDIDPSTYNSTEVYGLLGIGMKYNLGHGQLFSEIQYQHSFESVIPDFVVDIDMKNKGFSVGIGYAMSF